MSKNDTIKEFTLPEELHAVIRKGGTILVSGLANSGKTTMLHQLATEFDKKRNPEHEYSQILHRSNPKDGILPREHQVFYHYDEAPDFFDKALRMAPELIVDDNEIVTPADARDTHYASLTGHAIFATIRAESAQTAIAKYKELLPQYEYEQGEGIDAQITAVVHMKRDKETGIPVVGEVLTF